MKLVPVIITSSSCSPDGLSGLDASVFKGLTLAWSWERSGVSGGASWAGSSGCFSEASDAGTCCSGSDILEALGFFLIFLTVFLVAFLMALAFLAASWSY